MIKIELTDLPEFKDQLKITITLEKDGEGIKESITASPDPSPAPSLPSSTPDPITPPIKKRTKKSETTETKAQEDQSKNTGDGNIFEGPSVESLSPASTLSNLSSPTDIQPAKPRRRSGNMMGLEF